MHNPTVEAFVRRLTALEGGVAGVALSSGQAATTATLLALASPGAHVVFSEEMFGGTFAVANKLLEPWGCSYSTVAAEPGAIAGAIGENTVAVWLETIANPSCRVPDVKSIAALCREEGVPLVVDNTWGCGGYLCQPLAQGADIAVHSATKWIGGHGTFIGGAIVEAGRFGWRPDKFPAFSKADGRGRSYLSRGGATAFSLRAADLGLFTMGMTLSPYHASLALQGLETLSLRVQRSCDSALSLACRLDAHPKVARVLYPGLPSHPSHATAKETLKNGFGAVLSLQLRTQEEARAFLDGLRLVSHLANIGDAKTVAIHPWTTTHAGLSAEGKRRAGVSPELVRLSVGLEAVGDLIADVERALGGG
jgi:O-acetylhomoserine/O-acetylserine sulfhydrylase-like pyridoxal-dependent enzyme